MILPSRMCAAIGGARAPTDPLLCALTASQQHDLFVLCARLCALRLRRGLRLRRKQRLRSRGGLMVCARHGRAHDHPHFATLPFRHDDFSHHPSPPTQTPPTGDPVHTQHWTVPSVNPSPIAQRHSTHRTCVEPNHSSSQVRPMCSLACALRDRERPFARALQPSLNRVMYVVILFRRKKRTVVLAPWPHLGCGGACASAGAIEHASIACACCAQMLEHLMCTTAHSHPRCTRCACSLTGTQWLTRQHLLATEKAVDMQ
jgi:hypothetical protein